MLKLFSSYCRNVIVHSKSIVSLYVPHRFDLNEKPKFHIHFFIHSVHRNMVVIPVIRTCNVQIQGYHARSY